MLHASKEKLLSKEEREASVSLTGGVQLTSLKGDAAAATKKEEEEEEEADTTPYMKIYIVGAMLLVNHFSIFVIPTFLVFMVRDFFPGRSDTSLAVQIGALGAAFNAGQFISGAVWGSLADKIGRRSVLIAGVVGTMVGIMMFGFAPNYYVALTARFLWGVLNGNVPVAKTYLAEICDEKSTAKGMAVIGTAQSVGRLVAPILGGLLVQPADKYPQIFSQNGVFGKYRYCLPMLLGFAFCVITVIFGFFNLTESLPEEKRMKSVSASREEKKKNKPSVFRMLLTAPNTAKSVSLFVLLSFISTFLEDTLPVWLANGIAMGGLGYDSTKIGLFMTISAPLPLIFQSFVYPWVVFHMGYKHVYARFIIFAGIGAIMIPYANTIFTATKNDIGTSAFLVVAFSIYLIGRFYAFASVYALINNSCNEKQRGAVNGYAQSLSTGFRVGASQFGTMLLGATESIGSSNHFLGFHFLFYVTGVLCLISGLICFSLPNSINTKLKKEAKAMELSVTSGSNSAAESKTGLLANETGTSNPALSVIDESGELKKHDDHVYAPEQKSSMMEEKSSAFDKSSKRLRSGLSSSVPTLNSSMNNGKLSQAANDSLSENEDSRSDAHRFRSMPEISIQKRTIVLHPFYPEAMKGTIFRESRILMRNSQLSP